MNTVTLTLEANTKAFDAALESEFKPKLRAAVSAVVAQVIEDFFSEESIEAFSTVGETINHE